MLLNTFLTNYRPMQGNLNSGIREIFADGIWNLGNFSFEIRNRVPGIGNP